MLRDDTLFPQQQEQDVAHINVALRTMSAVSTFNVALLYHRKASSMMASAMVPHQQARHMLEKAKSMYMHALDVALPIMTRSTAADSIRSDITSGGSTLLLVVMAASNNLAVLLRKYGIDDGRPSPSSKLQMRIPQPRPSHSLQRIVPILRKTLHLLSLSSIQQAALRDLVNVDEWNAILMNVCQAYVKLTSKEPQSTASSSTSSVSSSISSTTSSPTSSRRSIGESSPTAASLGSSLSTLPSFSSRHASHLTGMNNLPSTMVLSMLRARDRAMPPTSTQRMMTPLHVQQPPAPAAGLSQQHMTALIMLLLQQQRATASPITSATTIVEETSRRRRKKKKLNSC